MTVRSSTKHLTGRVDSKQMQLLDEISREEKIDRSAALRKVLDIGIAEYMKRRAVEEFRRGEVSIGRAAEEAGVSIAEFYTILELGGVPIKIDAGALESDSSGE